MEKFIKTHGGKCSWPTHKTDFMLISNCYYSKTDYSYDYDIYNSQKVKAAKELAIPLIKEGDLQKLIR